MPLGTYYTVGRFDRCQELLIAELGMPAYLATSFAARVRGLAGLADDRSALLIPRCSSVHTFGMKFRLDLIFLSWPPDLSGALRIAALRHSVGRRRLATEPRASAVLEVGSGRLELDRLEVGDLLHLQQMSNRFAQSGVKAER